MTYPSPAVDDLLARHFVCHVVNTKQPGREGRELLRRHRLLWEPGLLFFDGRGNELRRLVGYRSPETFVAELRLALGKRDLLYRRLESSLAHFEAARDAAPGADTAPEAIYWAGIARFRLAGGDKAALAAAWDELTRSPSGSRWQEAADVLDTPPSGRRRSGPLASLC